MQLTINLPERETVLADVLSHWEQAIGDPTYRGIEGRIESNSFGQVIVNPPTSYGHGRREYRIARELEELLSGASVTECPVLTIDGVKGADVGWYTREGHLLASESAVPFNAPEIGVEVLSPGNTDAEMQHKRNLYFDAGVKECWICDLAGRMTYYTADDSTAVKTSSTLCPDFPAIIED